jgi:trans-L-3-hydroxyproline dehydratase
MQDGKHEIRTLEMHTGGEPVRIVTEGYPPIPGATILAKRRHARESLDHLRRLLMFEPRGHFDMYGVIPVKPDLPEADLAVLFMHNEGYSTMCGHAVMALGRYAVDWGLVAVREPETEVRIQCPCGLVTAFVEVQGGRSGGVRFASVPAFAFALERTVETRTYGPVTLDIGYGGAFYALAPAEQFGLDVRASRTRDLVDAAGEISEAVKAQVVLAHPEAADLGFLYGTILTDGRDAVGAAPSANICVFAESQVDRSPTGSGVTARIAVQHRRGLTALGESRSFESVTGARFTGRALAETRVGHFPAVTVEVAGEAHYCGEARFFLEPGDDIGQGFLLR